MVPLFSYLVFFHLIAPVHALILQGRVLAGSRTEQNEITVKVGDHTIHYLRLSQIRHPPRERLIQLATSIAPPEQREVVRIAIPPSAILGTQHEVTGYAFRRSPQSPLVDIVGTGHQFTVNLHQLSEAQRATVLRQLTRTVRPGSVDTSLRPPTSANFTLLLDPTHVQITPLRIRPHCGEAPLSYEQLLTLGDRSIGPQGPDMIRFLQSIPSDAMQRFTFIYNSESAQKDGVSWQFLQPHGFQLWKSGGDALEARRTTVRIFRAGFQACEFPYLQLGALDPSTREPSFLQHLPRCGSAT